MGEGNFASELFDAGEHLHEYLLCEVLLGRASRQMRSDDANDQWKQVRNKIAGCVLVAIAYALETVRKVEFRRFIGHKEMESATGTESKTHALGVRLPPAEG